MGPGWLRTPTTAIEPVSKKVVEAPGSRKMPTALATTEHTRRVMLAARGTAAPSRQAPQLTALNEMGVTVASSPSELLSESA
ncbi:hypothetical protein GCM10011600_12830 [Pseudolysinimonas yzui]|uniref:Uncharacterized protein n=1 Tax=Pseudolysinimonas yzui TaxID=2708254 RepID=A0A8J3GQ23_9MICO|nr:hypothetical protein GCM10011600_12830 [Pseudolysinimonas yzui]